MNQIKDAKQARNDVMVANEPRLYHMEFSCSTEKQLCQFVGGGNAANDKNERITEIENHVVRGASRVLNQTRHQQKEKFYFIRFHWNLKRKFSYSFSANRITCVCTLN